MVTGRKPPEPLKEFRERQNGGSRGDCVVVLAVASELCSEWLITLITGNLQGKS